MLWKSSFSLAGMISLELWNQTTENSGGLHWKKLSAQG